MILLIVLVELRLRWLRLIILIRSRIGVRVIHPVTREKEQEEVGK